MMLRKLDFIEQISYSHHHGNRMKPVLQLKPAGTFCCIRTNVLLFFDIRITRYASELCCHWLGVRKCIHVMKIPALACLWLEATLDNWEQLCDCTNFYLLYLSFLHSLQVRLGPEISFSKDNSGILQEVSSHWRCSKHVSLKLNITHNSKILPGTDRTWNNARRIGQLNKCRKYFQSSSSGRPTCRNLWSFASNLVQVADLLCAQVNLTSYPQWDVTCVVAYGLWGEGLVWLIGAVVCLLAANHGSSCLLTWAMDGCIVCCGIISSCQSAATSEIVKCFWSHTHVRSTIASTGPLSFTFISFFLTASKW